MKNCKNYILKNFHQDESNKIPRELFDHQYILQKSI